MGEINRTKQMSSEEYREYLQARENSKLGIVNNLKRGTCLIKEGHRIQGINPDGGEKIVLLTGGQIINKISEFENLGGRIEDPTIFPNHVAEIIKERLRQRGLF